jgi:hypothetical protein
MPGQLGDGVAGTRDANLANSKAFCEGMQAKALTKADTTNPHVVGSEASTAWLAGHAVDATSGVYGSCNISSAAFCEGRQAKAWGYLVGTNPYIATSDEHTAWDTGFAMDIGSGVVGPCDIVDGVTVPDVVTEDLADAIVLLEAAGLRLGTVTLITDPVASQLPAAGTLVQPNTTVNLTLTDPEA